MTECLDKMKFYARLNVPSRRAASIKKQVRLKLIEHVSWKKKVLSENEKYTL